MFCNEAKDGEVGGGSSGSGRFASTRGHNLNIWPWSVNKVNHLFPEQLFVVVAFQTSWTSTKSSHIYWITTWVSTITPSFGSSSELYLHPFLPVDNPGMSSESFMAAPRGQLGPDDSGTKIDWGGCVFEVTCLADDCNIGGGLATRIRLCTFVFVRKMPANESQLCCQSVAFTLQNK